LCSVLTFYDAGLWLCSLHGRRLGLCMRGGSGLPSGWRGFLFSHRCFGFIPIPGQVRGFPAVYTVGCQPSTTTKPNVLLGEDLHLQARPDYRHGQGAEDAGDVDQSTLSGCLLLGLGRCWLFSNSRGRYSTPLSNWGLARQLRQEFFYGGGWAAAGSIQLSHRIVVTFVPLLYGVGRWNLLQSKGISSSTHNLETQVLDYPIQGSLPPETWSL
jgi:hypothetical protein